MDGNYIKLHQNGLQGSRKLREQEAIGLSRGGMTTKLLAAVDEKGHLCAFVLTSGNLQDQTAARRMMEAFRNIHFVGDKGFDSLSFLFQRLKAHKRIALRSDKTASSFVGFIILAGILDRLHRL